jgi:hypothetical protein
MTPDGIGFEKKRKKEKSTKREFLSDLIALCVEVFSSIRFHWEDQRLVSDTHTSSISVRSDITRAPSFYPGD